jgi:hypothetical protein
MHAPSGARVIKRGCYNENARGADQTGSSCKLKLNYMFSSRCFKTPKPPRHARPTRPIGLAKPPHVPRTLSHDQPFRSSRLGISRAGARQPIRRDSPHMARQPIRREFAAPRPCILSRPCLPSRSNLMRVSINIFKDRTVLLDWSSRAGARQPIHGARHTAARCIRLNEKRRTAACRD